MQWKKKWKALYEILWKAPLHRIGKKKFWVRCVRSLWLSADYFYHDQCFLRASHLTFYTIMSIVPLLAIGFVVATGFGLQNRLEELLYQLFSDYPNLMQNLLQFTRNLLEETRGGVIAGVGILFLLWSVFNILSQVESSLNLIWRVKKERDFLRKCNDYCAFLFVAPTLFILANSFRVFVLTSAESIVFIGVLAAIIVPYLLMWTLFSLFYLWIPNTSLHKRYVFLSGAVSAFLYQAMQWAYLFFQIGVARYNAIYGSFAALPLFLTWIYTSWILVLWGGQWAKSLEEMGKYDGNLENAPLSPLAVKTISLWILYVIYRRFREKKELFTKQEIFFKVNIPPSIVEKVIDRLVDHQMLQAISKEETTSYILIKNIGDIPLQELLSGIENVENTSISIQDPYWKIVTDAVRALEEERRKAPANKLFKDV